MAKFTLNLPWWPQIRPDKQCSSNSVYNLKISIDPYLNSFLVGILEPISSCSYIIRWESVKLRHQEMVSRTMQSNVNIRGCSNVPIYRCSDIQLYGCSDLQMFRSTNVQIYKCSDLLMFRSTVPQTYDSLFWSKCFFVNRARSRVCGKSVKMVW